MKEATVTYIVNLSTTKALTLEEYAKEMCAKGELLHHDEGLELTENKKGEFFVIDSTGTACKVEEPYKVKQTKPKNK